MVGLIAFTLFIAGGVTSFALVSATAERAGLRVAEDRVYDRRL